MAHRNYTSLAGSASVGKIFLEGMWNQLHQQCYILWKAAKMLLLLYDSFFLTDHGYESEILPKRAGNEKQIHSKAELLIFELMELYVSIIIY
jgi:hypothetical protein